jgi:hypothetical protein
MNPNRSHLQRSRIRSWLHRGGMRIALLLPMTLFTGCSGTTDAAPDLEAAAESTAQSLTEPVGGGMYLAGFDADVARANGYEIVRLPDGSQASVPQDLAEAARRGDHVPTAGILKPQPGAGEVVVPLGYDEVPGRCGTSYVSLTAQGASLATLSTGMHLIPSFGVPRTVFFVVNLSDNGGRSEQGFETRHGDVVGNSWLSQERLLLLTVGTARATLRALASRVVTSNGVVCTSTGPSTTEEIH